MLCGQKMQASVVRADMNSLGKLSALQSQFNRLLRHERKRNIFGNVQRLFGFWGQLACHEKMDLVGLPGGICKKAARIVPDLGFKSSFFQQFAFGCIQEFLARVNDSAWQLRADDISCVPILTNDQNSLRIINSQNVDPVRLVDHKKWFKNES